MCALPQEVRKRVLDPVELELWMVVSYPVGAGNLACVFCKSNKYPNHGAISLGSGLYVFNNQHSSLAQ